MATKKVKTEYTEMSVEMVAGQRIEILLKYLDSTKSPIDISGLEFWSEWRDAKQVLISQISSDGPGNDTGMIEKTPSEGVNAFKLIIYDTVGFDKSSGTFDIWTIDSSYTPEKRTPIVYGQWKSTKFPSDQAGF